MDRVTSGELRAGWMRVVKKMVHADGTMNMDTAGKTAGLVHGTRVMTLAVSQQDIAWSSPVYFVFHDKKFYFFSNEQSRHIRYALDGRRVVAASVFHDADRINDIYGCQMTGKIEVVSKKNVYLLIVKKYITKFSFLKQVFGAQLTDNPQFFLEKFKSRLYCFCPETIFLSDNSRPSEKRVQLDIGDLI